MHADTDDPTDRNVAIARIRKSLKERTGRTWSVTGGKGTAWGWITIQAPPARREDGYKTSESDRAALAVALGLTTSEQIEVQVRQVSTQGVSIPASSDYRIEYVDRAEGRTPSVHGSPYWD